MYYCIMYCYLAIIHILIFRNVYVYTLTVYYKGYNVVMCLNNILYIILTNALQWYMYSFYHCNL